MIRQFLLATALLLSAAPVLAQVTGPVTTTSRIAWNAPSNTTLSDQPTYEVRLRDSTTPTVVTVLLAPTCVGTAPIACQVTLTPQNVDALNLVGLHSLTLAYFRADVGEGPLSVPFTLTSPVGAPTSGRIIP